MNGMRRYALCLTLFSMTNVSLSASRVEFENNRLKVDGKPFFFYGCWGTPNGNFAEFKRRHFNTAFMSWKAQNGPEAAAQGLMVIPYPYAPSWNNRVREAMRAIADKDWVLAWNIGDDLHTKEHVQAALKVRDEIRAIDPQKRPIMFDAIGLYKNFAKIPDMWCAYAYSLLKPAKPAPPARKPQGLREYGDWLNRMRLLGRPDGFFWTWAQCHVQIWYCQKFLGGTPKDRWKPSRFPDGDHLRLIAAHAMSAGCRGIMWFVSRYFQDNYFGRDRYARAAVIGCELDVVGPLLAQGTPRARLKTSDPSVWATPIDFPNGTLICLIKTGNRYNYQPDAAKVKNVKIVLNTRGDVYQIGFEFKKLREPVCSFTLTSWLLVTRDESLVGRLRERHKAVLPDMATFAVEELEARLAKVRPIFETINAGQSALRQAQGELVKAQGYLKTKQWAKAGLVADEALTILRAGQYAAWRATWDAIERNGLKAEVTDFYLLAAAAREAALLKTGSWGPNQLKNGNFESSGGWGGQKLAHDTKGKAVLVTGAGRAGSRALRLSSSSPTIYKGKPEDWVTVNLVSDKIAAKPGQIWEISAWVRIPKRFEQTQRGLTIALFAYDADGKRVRGYGALDLEEPRVEPTRGWRRMRLLVSLRSDKIAAIAARLAVCGVGEAFLDDVTVRQLMPAAE